MQSKAGVSKGKTKAWIEAVRLRTLPASLAGVVAGCGCAAFFGSFALPQALICFFFALIAQIASNFANEYYDFKNGLDKKGREGFRRGVTEGDISPKAMRNATFILLALDALLGCSLIIWGGWWLIPIGIAIALFALGYSAGPYPLSHHGLGDIAVVIFFGIVPVCLTAWLQVGSWNILGVTLPVSVGIGLLGANILIVNNYRDCDDDREVGKHTTVVIYGRQTMRTVYLFDIIAAALLFTIPLVNAVNSLWLIGAVVLLIAGTALWKQLGKRKGHELNPILGKTAMLLLASSLWLAAMLSLS